MRIIENLVFKGGGVLGTAYVGAFRALEEIKLAGRDGSVALGNIKSVAGTSAGSIVGCLVSLGLSADELEAEQLQLDYATLIDIDLTNQPIGIVKGEAFLKWMKSMVKKYLKKGEDATFKDLWDARQTDPKYKDFHAYSVNIDTRQPLEFSYQTTPDVPLAEAVRASMSIPFFFKVWEFSGELARRYPGSFIDGGVMYNYPITTFDSDGTNMRTLGFYLDNISYSNESIVELLFHLVEYYTLCQVPKAEVIKAVFENFISFLKDYCRLEKQGRAENITYDHLKESLLASLPQYIVEPSLEVDNKLLRAFNRIAAEIKTGQAGTEETKELSQSFLPSLELPYYLNEIGNFIITCSKVIGAAINLPTNIKFCLDSQRTVFLNDLGYHFADFWMPMCNKNHLVEAGYKTSQLYLQRLLYS